jgi:hypothetical protein
MVIGTAAAYRKGTDMLDLGQGHDSHADNSHRLLHQAWWNTADRR